MDDTSPVENGQPSKSKLPPGSFFQAPTAPLAAILAERGGALAKVFLFLCFSADSKTRECHPGVKTIAKACGLGERIVKTATSTLKKLGAISVKEGRPNTYRILYGATQCPLGEEIAGNPLPHSDQRGIPLPHEKCLGGTGATIKGHPSAPELYIELDNNYRQAEQPTNSIDHVQNFRDDVKNLPIESRPTDLRFSLPQELTGKAMHLMAGIDDVLQSNRNPDVFAIVRAAVIDSNANSAAGYALGEIEEQKPLKSHRIGRFISIYRKRLLQLWEEEQAQ